jgi:hypothetical protein
MNIHAIKYVSECLADWQTTNLINLGYNNLVK